MLYIIPTSLTNNSIHEKFYCLSLVYCIVVLFIYWTEYISLISIIKNIFIYDNIYKIKINIIYHSPSDLQTKKNISHSSGGCEVQDQDARRFGV